MKKQFAILSLIAVSTMAQTITQKIDVTVVNVDVVVTAPDGTPVRGLSRDDFQLFEDGVPQPITNFYAVATAATPAVVAPAAVPVAAPAGPPNDDPRFRRKVLLLIDNEHISKHARDLALDELEKFIDDRFHGGEYDWSIATLGGHLGMIMPLTSDKQRIHDTIAAIRNGGAQSADNAKLSDGSSTTRSMTDQAFQSQRQSSFDVSSQSGRPQLSADGWRRNQSDNERQIHARFAADAVAAAARAFAAAEGKKIILLLSDNHDFNDVEMTYSVGGIFIQRDAISPNQQDNLGTIDRDIKTLKDYVVAEANASNVSFYIIDPEGLRAPGNLALPDPGGTNGMTNSQGLYWLAADTGGRLMPGNDLPAAMTQFETRSSNYYSLGFHPKHDDGKYHKLTVKLNKPGNYELRYRNGYSNVSSEEQLERTLRSPMAMSAESSLPVTLRTEKAEPQKRGTVLVPFRATIPISKLQFLPDGQKWNASFDIYVSVFDADGKNLSFNRFSTSATAPSATVDPAAKFTYRNGVIVRKGPQQRLVVAFRDRATDAVGVAESVVQTE